MLLIYLYTTLIFVVLITTSKARVTMEEAKRLAKIHKAKMKCKDHPKMCDYYFSRGYYNDCAIGGVKWYFCPDSCGYCELLNAGTPIPNPPPGCHDFEYWCPRMAEYGECDSNEAFMKMFCRKSCNLCLEAPPCYDKDELCSDFARDGMCMLEPAYMTQFCQKSCDFCIKPTFAPKNICEDKEPAKCAQLFIKQAPHNPCTYNGEKRKWLSENCRKSCKMCAKTGDCFDVDASCPYNSQYTDYCTNKDSRYHTWMLEKCQYSCGLCKD
ncbi:putative tyrosinase-like protein tyr-3 [Clytia hemisphaerica]|uniref:ShKT domain-containing protein n=1 Tax=Clytia hemisphaerica TaxID=252671 RepID=A0A7M5TQA9_9CNID